MKLTIQESILTGILTAALFVIQCRTVTLTRIADLGSVRRVERTMFCATFTASDRLVDTTQINIPHIPDERLEADELALHRNIS